jgi:DNA helicase-2/ATP-dependent DNA helicase PcrA
VKFGGLKFLDAAHVKDVLACLRWAENPRDRVAGFRLLQLLPGFGPATAARILDRVAGAPDPVGALADFEPPRSPDAWRDFSELMGRLHLRASGWPAEFGLVRSWYEPHLARSYDDPHIRAADILQLEQIASGYPSRERFLTELTLDPPDAVSDEAGVPMLDEDYLILSTIHSAKGQEWTSVFVLNCVDGCIPSDLGTGTDEEIEEERRLLYVAMTRAKDQLSIMLPQRFYKSQQPAQGDRHLYAIRTRFIPDALLAHFELRSWPVAMPETARKAAGSAQVDVGARMRGMWR